MAIAREGDLAPHPDKPKLNVVNSFRDRLGQVDTAEDLTGAQESRQSLLSRFRINTKKTLLAVAALIVGSAIPVGAVAIATKQRPEEASWSKGEGREKPADLPTPVLPTAHELQEDLKSAGDLTPAQTSVDAQTKIKQLPNAGVDAESAMHEINHLTKDSEK